MHVIFYCMWPTWVIVILRSLSIISYSDAAQGTQKKLLIEPPRRPFGTELLNGYKFPNPRQKPADNHPALRPAFEITPGSQLGGASSMRVLRHAAARVALRRAWPRKKYFVRGDNYASVNMHFVLCGARHFFTTGIIWCGLRRLHRSASGGQRRSNRISFPRSHKCIFRTVLV